jgi:DNA-binding MarR family transcriptional regulator
MTNPIEQLVLMELRRIVRTTQLSAKSLARDSGMTTSQLVALQLLQNEGEQTASQIAEAMNLTQATVTSLLDRLQERGWVVRQRRDDDLRRVRIALTPDGAAQLARAPESLQERFVTAFRALQPWEQTSILASLQRVGELMHAASMDAAPVLDIGRIDRPVDPDI